MHIRDALWPAGDARFDQLRDEARRVYGDRATVEPGTFAGIVVLNLPGTQIRGRIEMVLELLRGMPEVARA